LWPLIEELSNKKKKKDKQNRNKKREERGKMSTDVNCRLIIYDLKEEMVCYEEPKVFDTSQLAISSRGNYIAVMSRTLLKIYRLIGRRPHPIETYSLTRSSTCLAFHPVETIVAVGDNKGQISFYHFSKEESSGSSNPLKTVFHWHAHRVTCLAFSQDGSYMISGGEEAVLVIWQLATGHKQFLPRLGGTINTLSISDDQSLYAMSLADNSVHVISSANLKPTYSIQGVKYDDHRSSKKLVLMIDPRTHSAVLNERSGSLQFYNLKTDAQIMEVSKTGPSAS
jgi:NET1-associated nuclear protein 1 (U3 small nucleolar RNA-associated protein 17)